MPTVGGQQDRPFGMPGARLDVGELQAPQVQLHHLGLVRQARPDVFDLAPGRHRHVAPSAHGHIPLHRRRRRARQIGQGTGWAAAGPRGSVQSDLGPSTGRSTCLGRLHAVRALAILLGTALACWGAAELAEETSVQQLGESIIRWIPVAVTVLAIIAIIAKTGQWVVGAILALLALTAVLYSSIIANGSFSWFVESSPGLLIVLGLMVNLATACSRTERSSTKPDFTVWCVLSRRRMHVLSKSFQAAKIWCFFGDLELDLTRANAPKGSRVDVRMLLGAVRIRTDWPIGFDEEMVVIPLPSSDRVLGEQKLTVHGVQILSDVTVPRLPPTSPDASTPPAGTSQSASGH
jgi:hypothetical protein